MAKVTRQIEEALWKAAIVIEIRANDVRKRPEDPEALHQYRISIRVARSLAKFLSPYLAPAYAKRLGKLLKRLQDPTSRMRELDVLVEGRVGSHLLPACEQAQANARAAFNEAFASEATQEALVSARALLKAPVWNKRVAKKGVRAKELARAVAAEQCACEEVLDTVDFADQEAVHDLRKSAKRLRYVCRELVACLPEGADATSERMREVQDLLGKWCDARVNAALLREICGEEAASEVAACQAEAESIVAGLRTSRED